VCPAESGRVSVAASFYFLKERKYSDASFHPLHDVLCIKRTVFLIQFDTPPNRDISRFADCVLKEPP
jgi:hypothetical protein